MICQNNMAARGQGLFSIYIYIENFKNLLIRNHWTDFNITYQDCSSCHDLSKNMAARRRGLFSLYLYIENLKILLVRNHWTNFSITWQKCFFGDPLPSFSSNHDSSKNMATRGRGLFYLYIYKENFTNLLVRNQWTDFSITWQECFLVDPLRRLFKLS